MPMRYHFLTGLGLSLFLSSCGGGSSNVEKPEEEKKPALQTIKDEESIQDKYLKEYELRTEAKKLEDVLDWEGALEKYQQSKKLVDDMRKSRGPSFSTTPIDYRAKYIQDQIDALHELITAKGQLPDVAAPEDGDLQKWFVKIQLAMKGARDLGFRDQNEMAYRHFRACVQALESLPEGFNEDIVAARRVSALEQMGALKSKMEAQAETQALAEQEAARKAANPEPEAVDIPALMGSYPAPMEGQQDLFLKTVEQVHTARRLEEQGKFKAALYEFEEALKKMKKMNPAIKDGDGGPDDEVRDNIRALKRKVK